MLSHVYHTAAVMFVRKSDGTWRFCSESYYTGLAAIKQRSVLAARRPPRRRDARRALRWHTRRPFPDPGGGAVQYVIGSYDIRPKKPDCTFGLGRMSSVLTRFMHSIFQVARP